MRFVFAIALAFLPGCREPASPLSHEAYVWQRAWTPGVHSAVSDPGPELTGLRVLAVEVEASGASMVWPEVDVEALVRSRRPITAVIRIDGSRPVARLSLAPLLERLDAWRSSGVNVVGVEVDHDCATAALASYADWLTTSRPRAPLRFSVTALPTWTGSRALDQVSAAVDEMVLQVHAVRAPRLFEAARARTWIEAFSDQIDGRPFRVALPTYSVTVRANNLAADPVELGGFVRELERDRIPGLVGVVWFRLPVDGDGTAWAAQTLRAVVRDAALEALVEVRLVERRHGLFDVVLENRGTLDGPWPVVRFRGHVTAADMVGGYSAGAGPTTQWTPPRRVIRAGGQRVVGWATGSEMQVDAL